MATLTLPLLFVNRLDTGEHVSGWSDPSRSHNAAKDVDFRKYAGGRIRAVRTPGMRYQFGFTLVAISLATAETLEDWIGDAVQVRDHRGQRFVGAYDSVVRGEYMTPTLYSASITLQTLTVTEGV